MPPQASEPSPPQQPLEDNNMEPLPTQVSSLDVVTDPPSPRNSTKSSIKGFGRSPKHSLDSQQSSGQDSDAGSTSTWEYGQETFETYKLKVAELCREIGRGKHSGLERMKGGSFNRVIGVEFRAGEVLKCVFRIPRCPMDGKRAVEIIDQITVLLHLSQFDFLHVPSIIAFDTTPKNAIGDQYILQERLPGGALQDVFYDLPMSEKLQITTLVAEPLIKMESITFPKPGRLIGDRSLPPKSHHAPSPAGIAITGFRESPIEDIPAFEKQNLASLLIQIFEYYKEKAQDISARNILIDHVASGDQQLDKNIAAEPAKECQHAGRLEVSDTSDNGHKHIIEFTIKENPNVVSNLKAEFMVEDASGKTYHHTFQVTNKKNLESSNQIADSPDIVAAAGVKSKEQTVPKLPRSWTISSVLDWDDAMSVPLVFARKPPTWLWFDGDKRTNSWSGDRDTKPERDLTPDELLIKSHFDQVMSRASPTYIEDAYRRGPWVRKLARFAIYAFGSSTDFKRYYRFVKEWEDYCMMTGLDIKQNGTMEDDSCSSDSEVAAEEAEAPENNFSTT